MDKFGHGRVDVLEHLRAGLGVGVGSVGQVVPDLVIVAVGDGDRDHFSRSGESVELCTCMGVRGQ